MNGLPLLNANKPTSAMIRGCTAWFRQQHRAMIPCYLSQIAIDEAQREQVVLLQGVDQPHLQLSIAIGLLEADGIAWQLRGQEFARPLTLRFSSGVSSAWPRTIKGLNIHRCEEGIYYAELIA